jgi:hypothetical protein
MSVRITMIKFVERTASRRQHCFVLLLLCAVYYRVCQWIGRFSKTVFFLVRQHWDGYRYHCVKLLIGLNWNLKNLNYFIYVTLKEGKRSMSEKLPRRALAIPLCQNAFRSFSLTATTRISHHGISWHATTRCGCYKTSTTRNFMSWLFWYCHNPFWLFFFRSLSVFRLWA